MPTPKGGGLNNLLIFWGGDASIRALCDVDQAVHSSESARTKRRHGDRAVDALMPVTWNPGCVWGSCRRSDACDTENCSLRGGGPWRHAATCERAGPAGVVQPLGVCLVTIAFG
eukprot:365756-Chlamydomonas_euryale.AAC.17